MAATLSPDELETAETLADPVKWAAKNLDWHCEDPDGEIWKRKNPDEYFEWKRENPDKDILGYSRYHRPYQKTMLRCSSQNIMTRCGRQLGKTDSLAISILYRLFVKPGKPESQGFAVVLITPYQSQIDLIFKRVEELINSNNDLKNSIKRNVKAPNYKIELWNGSTLSGFTAGTKSGGNADSARGQHADFLAFDEADYLSVKDIEGALSITTNSPNAKVWMSSTPTGKREKFYTNCFSKLWKEFHYSARINPLWTEQKDRQFREQMTAIAYQQEVEANFGEQVEGVFQNTFVQLAKANFEYKELKRESNWIYTMGVDWNDVKNGTTISVVGFSPSTNHFYMVDRAIVSREGWNQLAACEKVAEMNRLWLPASIYLDKGYGGVQYEVLRKFGYDSVINPAKGPNHPDSKLKDILKQYDFGSKVKIRDPFTQQEVEKPAKPYLIENAMRRFETKSISFPASDKKLEAQLLGYIIDHISPTGTPTFKAGNEEAGDHMLDALMLALVAFTLTKTPFGQPIYTTDISFSGYFGDKREQVIPGDMLVTRDHKITEQQKREELKPESRTDTTNNPIDGHLPGNNLNDNRNQTNRIYTPEAFNNDLPSTNRFKQIGRSGMIRRKNI